MSVKLTTSPYLVPNQLSPKETLLHFIVQCDELFQDVEAFTKETEGVVSDLEKLRQRLTRFRAGVRVSSVEEALSLNREMFDTTKDLAHKVLQAGLFPLLELLRLFGVSDTSNTIGTDRNCCYT